jgi:hypothetical protein
MAIEVVEVGDWRAFEKKFEEMSCGLRTDVRASTLLFRGQRNSDWPLTTTLERQGCTGWSFCDYHKLICRIRPAVETLTQVEWKLPHPQEIQNILEDPSLGLDNYP